jgi:pantetheine-phosphate adenylyltransferase
MEGYRKCTAVYPGTFDPLTNGHVSLIKRGLTIFDTIIVAVAQDTTKKPLFDLQERVSMARNVFSGQPRVEVEGFSGLLVDYVKSKKAGVVMRGLRAVSDFEYEFQMALMNRRLSREIQTIFLMTDYKWLYISSTIIKEAARYNGNIKGLVPEKVVDSIYERMGTKPLTPMNSVKPRD